MRKIVNICSLSAFLFLASCGAKSDSGKGGDVAAKKAKLEELKKEQQKITDEITALEAEIVKIDPSAKPEKTKLVTVSDVKAENFIHYIDLQGTVTSDDISYVAPRNGQGGLVKAVYVKQGDNVKKGQLLLKLDDAIYQKNLQQAQTQLKYAEDLLRRQKNLWNQQIGTELQLVQAQQNVDQVNDQIATLKEQMSMANVIADVSGVADVVNIRVGEFFSGNAMNPQIRIVNNSRLKVTTQVPENYVENVNNGSNVIVNLPDINKTFNSKISVSGKVIDPNSRSFYVDAKLPADNNLRPNQVALVKIQDYAASNAITAPVNTLQTDEKGKFVMVAVNEGGKLVAKKRPVEIGQLYGDKIEIKSGLQAGEQLITYGYQGVYDGQLLTTAAQQ
ncbi:efflux RND transporter periplasmic adaptor subunit [Panacibacter sp. DH6]|uniref:Efflux RND transporter periplasmic adaptor subunit n=1 Tax=Panacibacter microcysteis TaxID=2793269 RepID=A0A931E5S4_9BACT|nr:efflux RND transporter periplasmic adaptor subunit [Panacibacter microcysteis]MBG9375533.1 efflux RND transporter periplasmic adaptor subunit [Panacibacter microcysteis]